MAEKTLRSRDSLGWEVLVDVSLTSVLHNLFMQGHSGLGG